MNFKFYHLFANGSDASNFIVSEQDFIFQFNLIGVCAYCSKVKVAAFSIEETHPHFLLYGTEEQCLIFKDMYKRSSIRHIATTRGSSDGVCLNFEIYHIDDTRYLRNVAAYVITQSTKDGKPVMFYDYKWGSGSMYFRKRNHIPIWLVDNETISINSTCTLSDLDYKTRQGLCGRHRLPDHWIICNNLILPNNYIDVSLFENIFKTYNCFRVFTGASNKQSEEITETMSEIRGVEYNDYEARELASRLAFDAFKSRDILRLDIKERLKLSFILKRRHKMSTRQLSVVCRVPESEIKKYIK